MKKKDRPENDADFPMNKRLNIAVNQSFLDLAWETAKLRMVVRGKIRQEPVSALLRNLVFEENQKLKEYFRKNKGE